MKKIQEACHLKAGKQAQINEVCIAEHVTYQSNWSSEGQNTVTSAEIRTWLYQSTGYKTLEVNTI